MMESRDALAMKAPLMDAQLAAQVHERWAVKTGVDATGVIDRTSIKSTTIADLIAMPVPNGMAPTSPRQPPVETTVYELAATLTAYKLESDQDYHLVLSDDSQRTMIVEIPDPTALDPASAFKQEITNARQAFTNQFRVQLQALQEALSQAQKAAQAQGPEAGVVAPMVTRVSTPVTVTGIGFFDFLHGQLGVAPNGIELHPVLSVKF